MKIANFREYTGVLREIYTGEAMAETGNYYYTLMSSGKRLNQKKNELRQKIAGLSQKIQIQAEIVRQATDKRRAGLEVNKLKKEKQALVKSLKDLQSSDHFNSLSNDAKICVCSGFLFQKYLTNEILKNNPLHFQKNSHGDLIVDASQLRHSDLFTQAAHVKDFIAAYMARYPEKIKTAGYFKTLLNKVDNWQGIMTFVDENFDKLNRQSKEQQDDIQSSHQGAEVVLTFPEEKLFLLRLCNPDALDYESRKMEHCVGKGGYDSDVSEGKTQIYSLRSEAENGEWIPHATIEFKDGAVKQISGHKNQEVKDEYISATRESIYHLCQSRDMFELYRQKKVSGLKNCGYIFSADDYPIDLKNPPKEAHLKMIAEDSPILKLFEPQNLTLDLYTFSFPLTEEKLNLIKKFKQIKTLDARGNIKSKEEAWTVRQKLLAFAGKERTKKFSPHLLREIGFVYDENNTLHDLTTLSQEITISSVYKNQGLRFFMPTGLVNVKNFYVGYEIDEEAKSYLQKLKSIKNISTSPEEISKTKDVKIENILEMRETLQNFFKTDDWLQRLDSDLQHTLGFFEKFYPDKPRFSTVNWEDASQKYPRIWIDAINTTQPERISKINTNASAWPYMNYKNLDVNEVNIQGKISSQTIAAVNSLKSLGGLNIEKADLSETKELDFSQVKFLTMPQNQKPDVFKCNFMFREKWTISSLFEDHAIILRENKNQPPLNKIKLPLDIKHFGYETEYNTKTALPDFRRYPELESLQLNNLDLSDNKVIYLPKSIKYLAFYQCKFGEHPHMDLSGFENLRELRLNESDLSKIKKITLPQGLEKLETDNTLFNKDAKRPQLPKKTKTIRPAQGDREI